MNGKKDRKNPRDLTFGLLADPVNPSNEGEGSSTCGDQSTAPKNTPQKIA
jgi:hypothetical protein